MGKFKTTSRGGAKFVYTALKNKNGRVYAWKEHNMKTDKVKRVEFSKVKVIFASEYDKRFAQRLSKKRHISQKAARIIINDYRLHGKDFGELY